jgi:hypothetical protein
LSFIDFNLFLGITQGQGSNETEEYGLSKFGLELWTNDMMNGEFDFFPIALLTEGAYYDLYYVQKKFCKIWKELY